MPTRGIESLLAALGFTLAEGRLYDRLLPYSGDTMTRIVEVSEREATWVQSFVARLEHLGLAHIDGERVHLLSPTDAIAVSLARQTEAISKSHAALLDVARSVPPMISGTVRGTTPEGIAPPDGDMLPHPFSSAQLKELLATSTGDVRWFRPDQFEFSGEDTMADMVSAMRVQGRRVLTLYPVRMLTEAPDFLLARLHIGEEIRLLPEIPTRGAIVGNEYIAFPSPLTNHGEIGQRMLLREPAIIDIATRWFDELWRRASVPNLEGRSRRLPDERRLLLDMLETGLQDEAVARRLGVSLRTVRRRVADLMDECGVDSRFALGAEAVRRGWLH